MIAQNEDVFALNRDKNTLEIKRLQQGTRNILITYC